VAWHFVGPRLALPVFAILVWLPVFVFVSNAEAGAETNGPSTESGRAIGLVQNMDPKSLCAGKLKAFIAELDELLPAAPSSQPIKEAIQRSSL
jgi:hypothetical protein